MLRNNWFWIFIVLLSGGFSFAQEEGYYGKKTFVEFGAIGQFPVFQNVFGQIKGYTYKNGKLQEGYNVLDYSIRGAFSTVLNEKVALGLEVSNRWYSYNAQKADELNRQYTDSVGVFHSEYVSAKLEMIPVQETTIMPRVVFSNNSGRVPAGLTQELGLGYSMIRVGSDNLHAEVNSSLYTAADIQNQLLDDRMESAKGLVFLYGIRMNYPISKSLLGYVGFRYQYAYLLGRKTYKDYEETENWVSGREIWSRLNQRRQLGILNFGTGLILAF